MSEGLRRWLPRVMGSVLLLAATGFGLYWLFEGRYLESTNNAYAGSAIAVISPRVAAYVTAVPVKENQAVQAGDVLVQLDDREYQARLSQARSQQAAAEAALATIDARIVLQADVIREAEAALERAQAEEQRAQADYRRIRELERDKAASRQQLEEATAARNKAVADVAAANARLAAERQNLVVYQAERTEASAALGQSAAAVALAEQDVGNTRLLAPFDGVVGNKQVQVGEYLRPGTQVMRVVQLRGVYVTANFKETQLERMRPGQSVTIDVDAFPGETLTGTVESLSPASGSRFSLLPPENATGNFTKIVQRVPVRIHLPVGHALEGRLRPGMSVVATVDTRTGQP